ncbi:MAG: SH3 domain-containing protein [Sulfolobaceae archaeon]
MKFVDVNPQDWFYKDVYDLYSIILDDNERFVQGIPYNRFLDGKEAIDYQIVNNTPNACEFYLPYKISPTLETKLIVFVDSIPTGVDDIKIVGEQTMVKLIRGVPVGSLVRFYYPGEPLLKAKIIKDGVKLYSSYSESSSVVATVNKGTSLTYYRMVPYTDWYEVDYYGTKAYVKTNDCRVVPASIDTSGLEYPKAKLVLPPGFYYDYDPFNYVYPEIVKWRGVQLKRVESKDKLSYDGLEYCIEYDSLDLSSVYIYTSYVLNNEPLNITVIVKNDYGVIKWVSMKLTVSSNKIVYTNRFFPNLTASRLETFIMMYRTLKLVYKKYMNQEFGTEALKFISRFNDVQQELNATYPNFPSWWQYISPLEDLKLSDGTYLLNGDDKGNLNIDYPITRAELAALVNRLRKYIIELVK